jgi:hypothetical protein
MLPVVKLGHALMAEQAIGAMLVHSLFFFALPPGGQTNVAGRSPECAARSPFRARKKKQKMEILAYRWLARPKRLAAPPATFVRTPCERQAGGAEQAASGVRKEAMGSC